MLEGITFTTNDVATGITQFFGIGAVVAVLGLTVALKMIPKIGSAIRSLAGRR